LRILRKDQGKLPVSRKPNRAISGGGGNWLNGKKHVENKLSADGLRRTLERNATFEKNNGGYHSETGGGDKVCFRGEVFSSRKRGGHSFLMSHRPSVFRIHKTREKGFKKKRGATRGENSKLKLLSRVKGRKNQVSGAKGQLREEGEP